MSEFKKIWPGLQGASESLEINVPLGILKEQAAAINEASEEHELHAAIVTVSGMEPGELIHALYLLSNSGQGYNYRYIEFTQPIEGFYPVQISAFQTGDCDFGLAQDEEEVYDALEKIFRDERTSIVFSQLRAIGRTIYGWDDQRESA